MAEQTVTVGNATIVLSGPDDPFSDGHATGYLEFYDERHRPLFPLTSHAIRDHLLAILTEPAFPDSGELDVSQAGWKLSWRTPRRLSEVSFQRNSRSFCKMCKQKIWRDGKRANDCPFPPVRNHC